MTLIEIIKTSLLGFSTLFVLLWIFFYLYLKIKKSNNQAQNERESISTPEIKIASRPVVQNSPVFVQPVVYPTVNNVSYVQPKIESRRNNSERQRVSQRTRANISERFVVFNKHQYGFYNV